ncbi:divergent polysaccharide deacetylase family protein [Megalodesulfovibrio paquesii]
MRLPLLRALPSVMLAVALVCSAAAGGLVLAASPAQAANASGTARPGVFGEARIIVPSTPPASSPADPDAASGTGSGTGGLYPPPEASAPAPAISPWQQATILAPGNERGNETGNGTGNETGSAPASALRNATGNETAAVQGLAATPPPLPVISAYPLFPRPTAAPAIRPAPVEKSPDTPTRIVRPVVHPDAFEEALGAPLELTVRQVDAALLEAMQQCGIPADHLGVVEVGASVGPSRNVFQRLTLRLTGDAAVSEQALRARLVELLSRQAPHAALEVVRPGLWRIQVMGRLTHELILSTSGAPLPTPPPKGEGRLAIVIDDMGASLTQARELLAVDAPVVFSILPYTEHAAEVAHMAHAAGREVMVHLPMEPVNPRISPGRDALRVGMDAGTISRLTRSNLAGVPHAVGVNNHMGSRFTQQAALLRPALEVIKTERLFVLDSVTHERSCLAQNARDMGLTTYRRDVFLDVVRDASAILLQIRKAELLAAQHGQAVAIGHPYPETFEALRRWAHSRRAGVTVVRVEDLEPLRGSIPDTNAVDYSIPE